MNFLSSLFSGLKNVIGSVGKAAGGAAQSIGKGASGVLQSGANLLGNGGAPPFSSFPGGSSGGGKPPMPNPPGVPGMTPYFGGPSISSSSTTMPGFSNNSSPDTKKKGILDSLFPGGQESGIAGLAIPAIGNMFAPKVNVPDISSLDSVKALQGFKPGNSVSPEYQQMIQNNVGQLREQKVKELQALYHNARPGSDYLTDTNYQRDLALLDQGVQNNLTDELAKAEGTFSQQEQERLGQLAQMDVYSIMMQTGLNQQEANDFKQMFSNVGNMFLTNATKKPDDYSALMKLFGK